MLKYYLFLSPYRCQDGLLIAAALGEGVRGGVQHGVVDRDGKKDGAEAGGHRRQH